MPTSLVSIISEQAAPNFLFIKEFYDKVDKFLFVSTEQMEKKNKTNLLCETLNVDKEKRIKTLITDEYYYQNIEKLKKLNLSPDDTYLVNLTGGTKMMSITIWQFFNTFKNVRFFYVPLGKNYYNELFNDKPVIQRDFKTCITCKEYLNIYGIRYEESNIFLNKQLANDIFNDVKAGNFDLDKFPKKKLKDNAIEHTNVQLRTRWFEEYVYYRIKKELQLSDEYIITGAKLFEINEEKQSKSFYQNDNEVDVFFIYNNRPYIIECKFSIGKEKINYTNINSILYKLSAINKRFGISAKATIFTLSDLSTIPQNASEGLHRRATITNIYNPFFDRNTFLNNFDQELLSFVC